MAFVKRPFPITAHKANILSMSSGLGIIGWDITDEDVAPFSVIWPGESVFDQPSLHKLPALSFRNRIVAELGFYGKEGFMYVRQGLHPQVEEAIKTLFNQIIAHATEHVKHNKAELKAMERRAEDIIKAEWVNDLVGEDRRYRDHYEATLSHFPLPLLLNSVTSKLQEQENVFFYQQGGMGRGSLNMLIKSPETANVFNIGEISWYNGGKMNINVESKSSIKRSAIQKFCAACAEEQIRNVVSAEINSDQLLDEVQRSDMGY